jgi:ankyrin repeat protein
MHKLNMTEDEKLLRDESLKEWVDSPSKGEEGFTAMHFAAFHGNIGLVRLLISFGASLKATNK